MTHESKNIALCKNGKAESLLVEAFLLPYGIKKKKKKNNDNCQLTILNVRIFLTGKGRKKVK